MEGSGEHLSPSEAALALVVLLAGFALVVSSALGSMPPNSLTLPQSSLLVPAAAVALGSIVALAMRRSSVYSSCFKLAVARGVPEDYLEERLHELEELLISTSRSGVEVKYVRRPGEALLYVKSRRREELEKFASKLKSFGDVFEIVSCSEPRGAIVCSVLTSDPSSIAASVREVVEVLISAGWRVAVVDWKDAIARDAQALPPGCHYYSVGRVLVIPERVKALLELVKRESSPDLALVLVEPSELSLLGFEELAEVLGVGALVVVTSEPSVAEQLEACRFLGR